MPCGVRLVSPPDQAAAAAADFQAQLAQLLDVATNHQNSGRLEEAEQVYSQILGQRPQNPVALHRYGLLKYRQRDLEAAETLIRKALASRPNFPNAWSNLGVVLNDRGKKQEESGPALSHRTPMAVPKRPPAPLRRGLAP